MTRLITDSYKRFVGNKVDCKFVEKVWEWNNQLQSFAKDCDIDMLNALFVSQT